VQGRAVDDSCRGPWFNAKEFYYCLDNVGSLTSRDPIGLHGLVRGQLYNLSSSQSNNVTRPSSGFNISVCIAGPCLEDAKGHRYAVLTRYLSGRPV
jgi:hypothetical protein